MRTHLKVCRFSSFTGASADLAVKQAHGEPSNTCAYLMAWSADAPVKLDERQTFARLMHLGPTPAEEAVCMMCRASTCRARGGAPSGPRTADRGRGESGTRERSQSFQLRPLISGIGCLRAACASPVLPSQVTHFPNHSVYMHAVPCVNSQSSLVRPALSR